MNDQQSSLSGLLKTAALSVAVSAILSTSTFAADVTLKMHQFLPAQANVPKHILDVWADKVEKDSGGRIKIQHFPSMQLGGKPPELISQVQDGIADIIWTLPGYTPGRFPQTEVFELPFMMTNAEDTSRAFWEVAEERMLDKDFKDVKVLALWVHGPGTIHSKKPIRSVADLNGVKLRAPTRVTNMMFKSLGATAVGMPVPAVPQSLSKGVIDATVIPWEVTGSLKVPELVSHHTEFGDSSLYTATFLMAMNKDKYNALPDDLKKVIDDNSGAEFSAFAGQTSQKYDQPARDSAEENGNTIITLSEAEVVEWREASQAVTAEWVKEMDEKGLDGTGLLQQARELIEKYSAEPAE